MVEASVDVYVSENALIEVTRGEHLTVAQAFGIDWQSAPIVNVHPASMRALANFNGMESGTRRRIVDWVVPVGFVFVLTFAVWLVLR